jgi:hypothetical protein
LLDSLSYLTIGNAILSKDNEYTDTNFVDKGLFALAVGLEDADLKELMNAANGLLRHVPSSNSKLKEDIHQLIRFSVLRYAFLQLDSIVSGISL